MFVSACRCLKCSQCSRRTNRRIRKAIERPPGDAFARRLKGKAMVRLMTSLALALLTSVGVQAQTYPSRSAAVIVPFSPGGPTDAIGRIVADIFTRHLGQQFIVNNIGGAGGTTGALRAARARADGYTLVVGHLGTHAAAPSLYPNLGYDPVKDFEPVGLIAEQPLLLTVRKDFPASSLKEFATYAKAN